MDSTPSGDPAFAFKQRWTPALKPFGYTTVSNYFLKHYWELKPYPLTHGEAMFVIHLMQFKWTAKAPFPAYATLAERMGVSIKTARRFATSLQQKKYLEREFRVGATNRFHLDRLLKALDAHVAGDGTAPKIPRKKVREGRKR